MNKKIWNLYAPLYKKAMNASSSDRLMYRYVAKRAAQAAAGKDVLELAAGPGMLSKHIARTAKRVVATDYAEGMVAEAKKNVRAPNLTFAVADAENLPYPDDSFDMVLIANALHLLPQPEKALAEIDRVLKPGGVLVAPNFVEHKGGLVSRAWSGALELAGIRFAHQWTAETYRAFLTENGWRVTVFCVLPSRIPLAYAECRKVPSNEEEA